MGDLRKIDLKELSNLLYKADLESDISYCYFEYTYTDGTSGKSRNYTSLYYCVEDQNTFVVRNVGKLQYCGIKTVRNKRRN